MKNDFEQLAWEAFQEAAADKYDFTTCQRPDGSKYGSNGRCIKGSETTPASKDDKKSSSKSSGGGTSSGEYRTRPKGAIESDMKKLTSSGAMNQKGTAGVKAREEHAKLKAELNKPLKGANSKTGGGPSQSKSGGSDMKSLKSEVKKLGDEYEKLRKDKSPKAEARKKEIMSEVNENMKKQKELQTKLDNAAKSQSPKAPRDSSPAGAQRRSNAAMNARD